MYAPEEYGAAVLVTVPASVHGPTGGLGVLDPDLLLVHRLDGVAVVCSTPFSIALAPQLTLGLWGVTVRTVGVGAAAAGTAATAAASTSAADDEQEQTPAARTRN